jgi:hypothetical protein
VVSVAAGLARHGGDVKSPLRRATGHHRKSLRPRAVLSELPGVRSMGSHTLGFEYLLQTGIVEKGIRIEAETDAGAPWHAPIEEIVGIGLRVYGFNLG